MYIYIYDTYFDFVYKIDVRVGADCIKSISNKHEYILSKPVSHKNACYIWRF